jgi:hypothetical protein
MTAKIGSMTRRRWTLRLAALAAAVAICSARLATAQQTSWSVSTAGDLTTALAGAFNNNVTNPSLLNTITLTGNISGSSQWIVNANVNIVGQGHTIDMQHADRAFFIAGGTVGMSMLSIVHGKAQGGSQQAGGGGGAGLGGAIFVGSGTYYSGVNPESGTASVAALGISAPVVTLSSVSFSGNLAEGGSSLVGDLNGYSGGGGMGGMGYTSYAGGGGGGFGNGATGGQETTWTSAGAFINVVVPNGGGTSGGPGGNGSDSNGGPGGLNGGGGGAGGANNGSGGGGGVGGGRGYFVDSTPPNQGGNGGFGGGGGGNQASSGGNGGFGGGGGGSANDGNGGNGGFGGGGGAYSYNPTFGTSAPGSGGFGAGRGSYIDETSPGGGGGGLGAGGAIFVMNGASVTVTGGSFTGNAVTAGAGYIAGSAYGADLFSGANVTFDVPTTLMLTSLGGAGNTSDVNITNNYGLNLAGDPNANGGLIKTGAGTLTLTGTSYYSGITTVNSGTLALAPSATEQGTTVVTVGQNPGDVATLGLGSSSSLFLGGFNGVSGTDAPLVIAQAAGSTGTVVIGNGAGSNGADIGARVFTGGAGNASVVFTQQYWAAGTNPVYPFLTSLTGSLGMVQNGLGTTSLQPLYGPNTFTGPVTVNVGTLETTGTAAALAGATSITVNAEGALLLGQTNGVNDSAAVTLAGGELFTGTSLSETFGALNVTGGGSSIIDFMGNSSTLNFSSLSLDGSLASLAILNYDGANDFLNIASGTATGSLSRIAFYSDSGSTLLGYGGFEGTRLVPVAVPEPSTWAMALAGLACGGYVVRRRRKRD